MHRILLATAGVAALSIAAPAAAQGNIIQNGIGALLGGGGSSLSGRLNDINLRIQTSYQRGEISRSEATRLQNEVSELSRREQSYRAGGLSNAERNDLQQRFQVLEGRVEQAGYSSNDRDGREDRDDRDERWNDNDGRNDRDGRWSDNDDRNGRDDQWSNNDGRNGRDCPPGLARKNNGAVSLIATCLRSTELPLDDASLRP